MTRTGGSPARANVRPNTVAGSAQRRTHCHDGSPFPSPGRSQLKTRSAGTGLGKAGPETQKRRGLVLICNQLSGGVPRLARRLPLEAR